MIKDINNGPEVNYPEANEFSSMLKNIIDQVGTTNKYFVEFGFCDIDMPYDNTVFLKNHEGWDGLWLDIKPNTIEYNKNGSKNPERKKQDAVKIHKITAENINDLFEKYNVPQEPDLMIIDINFNDFWVWKSIEYKPRIVMIEYNLFVNPRESKVVQYDPDFAVDGTQYFSASFEAMLKLAREKGYELVGCKYANMIFVQKEMIKDNFDLPNDIYSLYEPPHPERHRHRPSKMEMISY